MSLTLLQSLSLPGDPAKANEDAFGHDAHAAVVIDGATPLGEGLMPGPSDAAWLAQFGVRRLMTHLREGDGARKALRATLADAQKSFEVLRRHPPEDMWQTPCASMMLAVETGSASPEHPAHKPRAEPTSAGSQNPQGRGGSQIELLWFGDCAALIKEGEAAITVVGETFDMRAHEADRAAQMAKDKKLSPTSGLSRPEFLGALRTSRNNINSGSNWLFSPDPRAASHVARRVMKIAPGSALLLATDGFWALASDYGVYGVDGLMAAALDKGLAALGQQLRAIEALDQGGDKFPRFKTSDDATALLLKVV